MVIDECQIVNLLESEDYDSGSACTFVRLDHEKGLKLYGCPDVRDEAYNNHKTIFGCTTRAPELFDKVDVAGYYGYVTQLAETLCDSADDEEMDLAEEEWQDAIDECVAEVEEAGYYYHDAHPGNFGFIDGHMVIIDFDYLDERDSFEDSEDEENCQCTDCRIDRGEVSDERLD